MNELEEMVFNSHAENLIKAKKRIKELESPMQEYINKWEAAKTIEDLKFLSETTKDEFKQLLNKG